MARRLAKQDPVAEARGLLERLSISRPPVPVERIAKYLGAQLRFSPLDDEISGMIFIKDAIPIIGVNALHHPHRQRFTIAHELAHLVLHRELVTAHVHVDKQFRVLMRDANASLGTDAIEIEANRFAAELLMPKSLLEGQLANQNFDVDDEALVKSLALRFKVSRQAMGHRISTLFEPFA